MVSDQRWTPMLNTISNLFTDTAISIRVAMGQGPAELVAEVEHRWIVPEVLASFNLRFHW